MDTLATPTLPRTRVLYLDHTAKLGGGEIALLNLVRVLDDERFEPLVVLASDGPLRGRLQAIGVETLVLPLEPSVVDTRKDSLGLRSLLRVRQAAHLLRYARRLARLIRERRVALVHTNSLKADLYGALAGRYAGVPVVWHVRDHIDDQYLPAGVARLFRRLARWLPQAVIANSQSTLRTLDARRNQPTAVIYSGVASVTVDDRTAAQRMVQVVHDGTPFGEGVPEYAGLTGDTPVVVLVGRIAPWKGQHIFIEAAGRVLREYPRTRFWIVGTPLFGEHEYEATLHRQVETLGVGGQVQFLGFRDDVPTLLALADVVVHASTLGEPFGQVVIEGMAAGKPVVATDGGALPEIVEHGRTGLLVPMGDEAAMAEAITSLLADPERSRRMGHAARQAVAERFTIEHTVRGVEEVYQTVLTRSRPSLRTERRRNQ